MRLVAAARCRDTGIGHRSREDELPTRWPAILGEELIPAMAAVRLLTLRDSRRAAGSGRKRWGES